MEDKLFAEYGVRKQKGGGESKVCSGAAKRIVR